MTAQTDVDTFQKTANVERFQRLVGELRSIGPDGPTYEVLSIVNDKHALIRILEDERQVEYDIEDILLDPGPDAAWKTR